MAGRERHRWPSGPRLPAGPRSDTVDELIADPANGAKVPRCLACGSPQELVTFELWLRGKHAGWIRLCAKDYYFANPVDPQAGVPLQAA